MFAVTANEEYGPKPHNYTIIQAFEWYSEGGGKHWKLLQNQIPRLAEMGITALWLPPVTKASGGDFQKGTDTVGYDIYDLWDLVRDGPGSQKKSLSYFVVQGEFDQKAGRRTKYGTKEDLLALLQTANDHGLVW